MHAYVISLARSSDRRRHIKAQLTRAALPHTIADAVDGRDLDLNDPTLIGRHLVNEPTFHPGVAGCSLSHLKIYQQVLTDGVPVALVLEDDAILPVDINQLAGEISQHLCGAEIALLNFYSSGPCRLSAKNRVELTSSRSLAYPMDIGNLTSSAAYLITRDACARMAQTILPVRVHADDWAHFYQVGALDQVRCVDPRPVRQHWGLDSTMSHSTPNGFRARIRETIVRYRVPPLYHIRAWSRRNAGRMWTTEFVAEASPQSITRREPRDQMRDQFLHIKTDIPHCSIRTHP